MALVRLNREVQTNRPKPFKFFNFWTVHPNFLNEVIQSWQPSIKGNLKKVLFLKLKCLKVCLKIINKECYSDISTPVLEKKNELEQIQLYTLRGEDTIEKELFLQNELLSLEEAEGMFLKQKAKVQWLKEGDKCTKIFHSIISGKNKRDTIRILVIDQGRRLESFEGMASEISVFYSCLLGTADSGVKNYEPNLLKNLMQFNLPSNYSFNLVKEVTGEEIKEAIFNQGNDKAPYPDRFTPYFFKKS
ncbi:uncharacterized protein LOC120195655 [Hibiscus syriacus]|uniref:uncharacterized protein LOC120195655 n=1 Tax=Hibiscus syriacus TaxID=106335 RepID=UPI00192329B0|nr:uncharacterized protein LOC120195655 [Hibiscus syriacus]